MQHNLWYSRNIIYAHVVPIYTQMGVGNLVCFLYFKAGIRLVQAAGTMRTWCTRGFCVNFDNFFFTWKSFVRQKTRTQVRLIPSLKSFSLPLLILSWSIYVAPLDMWIGPSCLTDVLFWTGSSAVLCILSSDTVGTPQLVASIWASGTVLSRCFSPQTRRFPCQRELAALILHLYMCHYACVWALSKLVSRTVEQIKMYIERICLCGKVYTLILDVIKHVIHAEIFKTLNCSIAHLITRVGYYFRFFDKSADKTPEFW